MIEIPLSKQGKHKGKYVAVVDDVDKILAERRWCALVKEGYTTYARDNDTTFIHRIVMERMIGRPIEKGEYVDHIDGNGLNNTRDNLRLATPSQNCSNKRMCVNNKSGYKGVYWSKRRNKWAACIRVNKRNMDIGFFDTAQEAHEAYCEKAKELFGEFARFE